MHFYPGLTPPLIADMALEQTLLYIRAIPVVAGMMQGEKPPKSKEEIRKEIQQARRAGKINKMPEMKDGLQQKAW